MENGVTKVKRNFFEIVKVKSVKSTSLPGRQESGPRSGGGALGHQARDGRDEIGSERSKSSPRRRLWLKLCFPHPPSQGELGGLQQQKNGLSLLPSSLLSHSITAALTQNSLSLIIDHPFVPSLEPIKNGLKCGASFKSFASATASPSSQTPSPSN